MRVIRLDAGISPMAWANQILEESPDNLEGRFRDRAQIRLAEFLATRLGMGRNERLLTERSFCLSHRTLDAFIKGVGVEIPSLDISGGGGQSRPLRPRADAFPESTFGEADMLEASAGPMLEGARIRASLNELIPLTTWEEKVGDVLQPVEPTRINVLKRIINWLAALFGEVVFSRIDGVPDRVREAVLEDISFVRTLCAGEPAVVQEGINAYFTENHSSLTAVEREQCVAAVLEGIEAAVGPLGPLEEAHHIVSAYLLGLNSEIPTEALESLEERAGNFAAVSSAVADLIEQVQLKIGRVEQRREVLGQDVDAARNFFFSIVGSLSAHANVSEETRALFDNVTGRLTVVGDQVVARSLKKADIAQMNLCLDSLSGELITQLKGSVFGGEAQLSTDERKQLVDTTNNLLTRIDELRDHVGSVAGGLFMEELLHLKGPYGTWNIPDSLLGYYGNVLWCLWGLEERDVDAQERTRLIDGVRANLELLKHHQGEILVDLETPEEMQFNQDLMETLEGLINTRYPDSTTTQSHSHRMTASAANHANEVLESALKLQGVSLLDMKEIDPQGHTLSQLQAVLKKTLQTSAVGFNHRSSDWNKIAVDVGLFMGCLRDHCAMLKLRQSGARVLSPYSELSQERAEELMKRLEDVHYEVHQLFSAALQAHGLLNEAPLRASLEAMPGLVTRLLASGVLEPGEGNEDWAAQFALLEERFNALLGFRGYSEEGVLALTAQSKELRQQLPHDRDPFLIKLKAHMVRFELELDEVLQERMGHLEASAQGTVDAQFSLHLETLEGLEFLLSKVAEVEGKGEVFEGKQAKTFAHEVGRLKHYLGEAARAVGEHNESLAALEEGPEFNGVRKHIARLEAMGPFDELGSAMDFWVDALHNSGTARTFRTRRNQEVEAVLERVGLRDLRVLNARRTPSGTILLEVNRVSHDGTTWVKLLPVPRTTPQRGARGNGPVDRVMLEERMGVVNRMNSVNRLKALWTSPDAYVRVVDGIEALLG